MDFRNHGRFIKRSSFLKYKKVSEIIKHTDHPELSASYSSSINNNNVEHNYARIQGQGSDFSDKLAPVGHYRCIVELDVLIEGLRRCQFCQMQLSLIHSEGILHAGLGGWVHIRCPNCNFINKIPLCKQHQQPDKDTRGRSPFDINTKLATAMIHSGIGYTQVQHFLTTLNLHGITHTSLKERETEIGGVMEELAEESVKNALAEEIIASSKVKDSEEVQDIHRDKMVQETGIRNIDEDPQGHLHHQEIAEQENYEKKEITVSSDATWQRRGAGRSYNSLSGVSTLIGKQTKKMVSYSIRCKRCRVCDVAKRKNKIPIKHVCRRNWKGSAKAMEGSMLVEMLKDIKNKGANIKSIIGDNDSTATKMAKEHFDPNIQKFDDRNHIMKNITNQLYIIKNQHKELSQKTIDAVLKNFRYMLQQNQGNEDGISKGLKSVVNHPFGNHIHCNIEWCGYLKNPESYKHKNLPHGKDLTDTDLKEKLENLFITKFGKNVKSLSNLCSTQGNESFNCTLASKAPKAKHFSDSSSLNYRVCASICQKNEGYSYVSKVHEKANLSPGNATVNRTQNMDKLTAKRRLLFGTKDHCKRRLILKNKRKQNDSCQEIREGDTYRTSIDLDEEADTIYIPDPVQVEANLKNTDHPLVVFDLETTGLSRTSEIIQIAAICGEEIFSSYVLPSKCISEGASKVTGITYKNSSLYHKEVPVEALIPQIALIKFCEFLEQFHKPLLIGHNSKRFDSKILMNQLKSHHMWSHFSSIISGFVDSLEICKIMFPHEKSYKQSDLIESIMKDSYAAHDALEDVTALQKLLMTIYPKNKQLFSDKVFHPVDISSFSNLISSKVVTTQTANKIITSGLTLHHLITVYNRGGKDGLKLVLSESVNGTPRVTNSSVVVKKMSAYFESMKENTKLEQF